MLGHADSSHLVVLKNPGIGPQPRGRLTGSAGGLPFVAQGNPKERRFAPGVGGARRAGGAPLTR